jgi:glyoxylase-like metal-dependent hydrolase (beta-lactamase superfamily II)
LAEASPLYFRQVAVGQMANFAYLIGSRVSRKALVVDPAWEIEGLLEQLDADGMQLSGALVTHYHQDHVGGEIFGMRIAGVAQLLEQRPVPIHVNRIEADGVRKVTGASDSDIAREDAGNVIDLGEVRVRLLHTPGHTPGSQCFLVEEAGAAGRLVSGDTLFLDSCGRVDLPGGDPEALYHSLNDTLKQLPDETILYPGHFYASEPFATLGSQKRTNPFLRVNLQQFLNFLGA